MIELYNLKDEIKNSSQTDLINHLLDSYRNATNQSMKQNAMFYALGCIDILYRQNLIDQADYTQLYKFFGL